MRTPTMQWKSDSNGTGAESQARIITLFAAAAKGPDQAARYGEVTGRLTT